jgi:hypothetical protein
MCLSLIQLFNPVLFHTYTIIHLAENPCVNFYCVILNLFGLANFCAYLLENSHSCMKRKDNFQYKNTETCNSLGCLQNIELKCNPRRVTCTRAEKYQIAPDTANVCVFLWILHLEISYYGALHCVCKPRAKRVRAGNWAGKIYGRRGQDTKLDQLQRQTRATIEAGIRTKLHISSGNTHAEYTHRRPPYTHTYIYKSTRAQSLWQEKKSASLWSQKDGTA